jgi:hypothetical protein
MRRAARLGEASLKSNMVVWLATAAGGIQFRLDLEFVLTSQQAARSGEAKLKSNMVV